MAAGYLLDDQLVLIGPPRVVGFGDARFAVREMHRDHANAIIRRSHYSKTFVANSYVHLGVEIDGDRIGVLQFGYAMNPASAGGVVEGTANDEYLELNRMWLDDWASSRSESRAIAYAMRYIRRAWPKVRWVQSFADERCGLFGTVYQAANFDFVGEHVSTFWELDGETFHNILMTTKGPRAGQRGLYLQANRERAQRRELRQFRYLYFMAPRFRRGLKLPVLPYPKATRPSDEPAPRGCEPGVTPGGRSNLIVEPGSKVVRMAGSG